MTIGEWLKGATSELTNANIATAHLDALVLLEDALAIDRSRLLAHPELALPIRQKNVLNRNVGARARHVPLAYLRHKTEFYGREFIISAAVLEPRPESETMIDMLIQLLAQRSSTTLSPMQAEAADQSSKAREKQAPATTKTRIADIGTGSGAIGITAQLELENVAVELVEIESAALKVAKRNTDKYQLNLALHKSDLLSHTPKNYDILLCNLPYIPDDFQINTAALHEPRISIFGGPDGLDIYRKLFVQADKIPQSPAYVLTEALPTQHEVLAHTAHVNGYQLKTTDDFIQLFARV